jgi:hypothetical protein
VWVNTCNGQYTIIPANVVANCSPSLHFTPDCCGRICDVPSIDTCPHIEVQPTPCSSPTCP